MNKSIDRLPTGMAAGEMDPRERLAFRVAMLSNMLSRWAARSFAARHDIHLMDWRILAGLRNAGPATASELCDFAVMDRGNASRVVRRLLARGLISQRQDPKDGRKTVLSLKARGRRLCDKAGDFVEHREARLIGALNATERRQFGKILTKLEAEARVMLGESQAGGPD